MKLHRVFGLLLKHYYTTTNKADRLFDMFYWPAIDLFVWGFASVYISQISDYNLLSMILGGIILWIFVWRGSQDIAVYMLEDFWSKNLYHLFSSPVKLSEHLLSVILFAFFRSIISGVAMGVLAYIMYSFNILSIPIAVAGISVFLLSLFGWIMGLFVAGLILRYGQRIQVLGWSTVWVVQPFSCVFYPLSALPAWAKSIAVWLPTTYVFENMRAALAGSAVDYGVYFLSFLVSLALLGVMLIFVYRSFLRARKTGLLARGD
ncbi:MAG TPA: ABC transporter permease [Candidatus Nanoarchaeia archaeon]|nr:ABC transporter permease [Candidatus Nanoarchaeia archaeon]